MKKKLKYKSGGVYNINAIDFDKLYLSTPQQPTPIGGGSESEKEIKINVNNNGEFRYQGKDIPQDTGTFDDSKFRGEDERIYTAASGGSVQLKQPFGIVNAEGGEDVYRQVKGRWYHIKDINGKSHKKGGEDIKLQDGDFVIPKDKAKKIKEIYDLGNQFKLNTEFRKIQVNSTKKEMESGNFISGRKTMEGGGMFSNAASAAYNLYQYKTTDPYQEKEQKAAYFNPYESKAINTLAGMKYNADPMVNELNRNVNTSYRAASDAIYSNTNNANVARANIAGAYGKALDAKRTGSIDIRDREQQINNQYKSQLAQAYDTFGQQRVGAQLDLRNYNLGIRDYNQRSKAAHQALLGASVSQMGAATDAGMQFGLDAAGIGVDAFSSLGTAGLI